MQQKPKLNLRKQQYQAEESSLVSKSGAVLLKITSDELVSTTSFAAMSPTYKILNVFTPNLFHVKSYITYLTAI